MLKKIFISNKFLAFVILILIIGTAYGFYMIFFVKYVGDLEINSNIEGYKVSLYAKSIYTRFNYNCENKICNITKLSPFEYEATFTKDNYKTIVEEIKIIGKKKNKININFIKDTTIVEKKNQEVFLDNEKSLENYKNGLLYFTNLAGLGNFYFKENGTNLDFYRNLKSNEEKLFSLAKTENNKMNILQIYGLNSKIFLSYGDKKFIYNLENKRLIDFKLKANINYVKLGEQDSIYQLVTDLGTYFFDENTKETSYFYLFKDFVSLENNLIGIIFKNEKNKFDNFGIKNNDKNVIIDYNPQTLERIVIFETELNIVKILLEDKKIYIYDTNGTKYELKNY